MKKVVALIAMLSLAFFASCSTEETNVEVETGTGVEANAEVTTDEEVVAEEEEMNEEVSEEEEMTDTEGNEVDEEAAAASLEADAALEILSEESNEEEMAK